MKGAQIGKEKVKLYLQMTLKILNILKKFEESTIKAIIIGEYSKVARCKLVFKKFFFYPVYQPNEQLQNKT